VVYGFLCRLGRIGGCKPCTQHIGVHKSHTYKKICKLCGLCRWSVGFYVDFVSCVGCVGGL
jgi:hypothetical protein